MNAITFIRADVRGKPRAAPRFPTVPLCAAMALIGISAGATVFGSMTGIGTVHDTFGRPAAIRDIVIAGGIDEKIDVVDVHTRAVIATYNEGEGGFVRGSMRALSRIRFVTDVGTAEPYRIIRWESGAVTLSDTVSGERIYLDAFGPDNAAAFEGLLEEKGSERP
jgi:putative photosynthetic complex assembly protein